MTEEEQLSRRLHGLVAQPPVGRNLVPAIRKAAARRRTGYLALGSGVGVTTVVLGGAGLVGAFNASGDTAPPLVGATPSRSVAVSPPNPISAVAIPSRLGLPSAPAAAGSSALAPSMLPSASPSASVSTGVPTSSSPGSLGPAAANFFYSRTDNEQYGIRTVVGRWFSRTAEGAAAATSVNTSKPGEPPSLLQFDYRTHYNDEVPWAAFSVVPSAEQLHRWMFGSPVEAKTLFGYDLTGTARGNEYAFQEGLWLINETPSTPAFRLAVLEALKAVPGVASRHQSQTLWGAPASSSRCTPPLTSGCRRARTGRSSTRPTGRSCRARAPTLRFVLREAWFGEPSISSPGLCRTPTPCCPRRRRRPRDNPPTAWRQASTCRPAPPSPRVPWRSSSSPALPLKGAQASS